jgi:cytochrome c553
VKPKLIGLSLAASMLLAAGSAMAQGAANPPPQAQQCIVCHGVSGLSNTPDAPHLAGQPRLYLVAQLKAYRNGTRQHAVMNVIAKPLNDSDISSVADWFSAMTISVQMP